MSADKVLSTSMKKASEKAASYQYDKNNYIVVDMSSRRDVVSGRLVSVNKKNLNNEE